MAWLAQRTEETTITHPAPQQLGGLAHIVAAVVAMGGNVHLVIVGGALRAGLSLDPPIGDLAGTE